MNEQPDLLNTELEKARNLKISLVLGIIFVAINLRMPITSISPLLELIRKDLPISNTLAGFLTTLPLIAFAVISPFVSKLSRKLGVEQLVFYTLLFLVFGSFIRPFGDNLTFLLIGTLLIGIGIAVGNVILPSIIKKEFPFQLGLLTGIYSISMNLFAAIASGLSFPLANNFGLGWRGTLYVFSAFTVLALLIWLFQLGKKPKQVASANSKKPAHAHQSVWKSKLAWQIAVVMGVQSAVFYINVAWLPVIVQDRGFTAADGGFMLSLMQFGIIPITFIIPIIAGKTKDQRVLMSLASFFICGGIIGLMLPIASLVYLSIISIMLGVGGGMAFSLSMMFFSLRTSTPEEAAETSGMAQSVGYLLAAFGPLLFGFLHDALGNFEISLFILLAAGIGLFLAGLGAAKDQKLFDISH
ncbi:CynX/NimT family MFS transporter [Listeria kieliensis]|uniref:Transporter n=1 Tax=Listeria kieliensis TaxID=1621700 RepID=A0A3D8TT17_9LIST|nr:MFS transporter [Listeria kieliensis]RDX02236.1 transporter [Listeria kieliensis]